jgi:Ser/Thr protein kinase RdoA (MazF antagonist)
MAWGPNVKLIAGPSDQEPGRSFRIVASRNTVSATLFEGILRPTSNARAVEVNGVRGVAKLSKRISPALDWELGLVEHLADLGVAPRLIHTSDGSRSFGPLFIMEWVTGDVGPAFAASENWWELEVAALRKVHAATRGWPQCPGLASSRELLETSVAGDVDLRAMPSDVLDLCREAWAQLPDAPCCAIHGDPGADNVVVTSPNTALLLDWAYARVDHPWFDLEGAPESLTALRQVDRMKAQCASIAWQVADNWDSDPEWALDRLDVLRRLMTIGA